MAEKPTTKKTTTTTKKSSSLTTAELAKRVEATNAELNELKKTLNELTSRLGEQEKKTVATEPLVAVQLDPGASLPVRAHDTDTGYDVRANVVTVTYSVVPWYLRIFGAEPKPLVVAVDTGVHVQPQKGYWTLAVPNSRISKRPFVLGNSVGIIDSGYTGSIKFVYNVLPGATVEDIESYFALGNVVGQLIPVPITSALFEQVDSLVETERGDGGFGSTAK